MLSGRILAHSGGALGLLGLLCLLAAGLAAAEEVRATPLEKRQTSDRSSALRLRQDLGAPAVSGKGGAAGTRARDGQTVIVGSAVYRLWGIAAPGLGEFGGYGSRQGLIWLIGTASVVCAPTGLSVGGVAVGRCKVDGRDLSAAMVAHGWARDCPRQSRGTYAALERQNQAPAARGELAPECLAED